MESYEPMVALQRESFSFMLSYSLIVSASSSCGKLFSGQEQLGQQISSSCELCLTYLNILRKLLEAVLV